MKQIRLLPVVIAAALALLVLKGFGIMTGGGYVLTGPTQVQAAGDASGGSEPAGQDADAAGMAMPVEPTMTDSSPVLDDGAPTIGVRGAPSGHGDPGPAAEEVAAGNEDAGGEGLGDDASAGADGPEDPDATPDDRVAAGAGADCPPVKVQPAAGSAGLGDEAGQGSDEEGLDFIKERENCPVEPMVNEAGDALPMVKDDAGNLVPMATADGRAPSEGALMERLSERRQVLDTFEGELEMRLALVEAAEKRIEERAAALEILEARIEAMVDEKRSLEESQFVSVVAMYETMKPKDAAAIFDALEMPVLLHVSRAISPRKMAPIMARMDPIKAKDLTAGLAVDQVEPTIDMAGQENLAALPQIIGQ